MPSFLLSDENPGWRHWHADVTKKKRGGFEGNSMVSNKESKNKDPRT